MTIVSCDVTASFWSIKAKQNCITCSADSPGQHKGANDKLYSKQGTLPSPFKSHMVQSSVRISLSLREVTWACCKAAWKCSREKQRVPRANCRQAMCTSMTCRLVSRMYFATCGVAKWFELLFPIVRCWCCYFFDGWFVCMICYAILLYESSMSSFALLWVFSCFKNGWCSVACFLRFKMFYYFERTKRNMKKVCVCTSTAKAKERMHRENWERNCVILAS